MFQCFISVQNGSASSKNAIQSFIGASKTHKLNSRTANVFVPAQQQMGGRSTPHGEKSVISSEI